MTHETETAAQFWARVEATNTARLNGSIKPGIAD